MGVTKVLKYVWARLWSSGPECVNCTTFTSDPKGFFRISRKIGSVFNRVVRVSKLNINEALGEVANC